MSFITALVPSEYTEEERHILLVRRPAAAAALELMRGPRRPDRGSGCVWVWTVVGVSAFTLRNKPNTTSSSSKRSELRGEGKVSLLRHTCRGTEVGL